MKSNHKTQTNKIKSPRRTTIIGGSSRTNKGMGERREKRERKEKRERRKERAGANLKKKKYNLAIVITAHCS